MTFLVGKVDGNIAADLIQQLAITQVFRELHHLPTATKNGIGSRILSLLNRSRNDFLEELVHICLPTHHCSYALDGIAERIVGVTIAAARHHKTLSAIVHHLGLTLFHKGCGSSLVAYIDILAILHGKGLNNLVTLGGIDLSIDHEVGARLIATTGQHPQSKDDSQHCENRQDLFHNVLHIIVTFILYFLFSNTFFPSK